MVEFKRKKGESLLSFLRRFNKALIQSRKLNEVRQRQWQKKSKNKNQQKKYALVSKQMREKKEYLRKTGKLKEETKNRW